jgi:hypothetical protein
MSPGDPAAAEVHLASDLGLSPMPCWLAKLGLLLRAQQHAQQVQTCSAACTQ